VFLLLIGFSSLRYPRHELRNSFVINVKSSSCQAEHHYSAITVEW